MANISPAEFNVAMDRLKKEVSRGVVDPHYGTLSTQGRLLLERIMKFTPAKTEDQQRGAIRSDLWKVFEIRREETITAAIKKFGRGRISGWVNDEKTGVHLKLSAAGAVLTMGEAQAVHRANLSARGRTKSLGAGFKYFISPKLFAQYLDHVYLRIGQAKAGWLPAAARLFAANIPGWVLRHSPGNGVFVDGRSAKRPFIEARNTTRWSLRADEGERIVNGAIAARLRDMKRYIVAQSALAAKRAGLTTRSA